MDQYRWESDFAHIFVGYVSKEMPGRGSFPKEYLRGYFLDYCTGSTVKGIKLFFQAFPTLLKVLFLGNLTILQFSHFNKNSTFLKANVL